MAQGKRSDVGTDVRRDSSHQFNPQSVTQQLVHVHREGDHGDAHLGGGGTFTLSAATMERRVESPFNLEYPSCVYNEDKAATNKKRKDVTWGRGITSNLPTVLLKLNVKKSPIQRMTTIPTPLAFLQFPR